VQNVQAVRLVARCIQPIKRLIKGWCRLMVPSQCLTGTASWRTSTLSASRLRAGAGTRGRITCIGFGQLVLEESEERREAIDGGRGEPEASS